MGSANMLSIHLFASESEVVDGGETKGEKNCRTTILPSNEQAWPVLADRNG